MAYSKAQLFPEPIFIESLYAKALAHPARIEILKQLYNNGRTRFSDLATDLPIHRTTVSQHIRTLRQLSIIEYSEETPFIYYGITSTMMDRIQSNKMYFRRLFENSGDYTKERKSNSQKPY